MKRFQLNRREDPSHVSGLGIVAEGVQFHDGQTVISWFGQQHSIEVWPSVEAAETIHGHGGLTTIEWQD